MKLLDEVLDNFLRPWRRYADFSGRASRSEFWTFALGCLLISMILDRISDALGLPATIGETAPLVLAFQLAFLVPGIAVTTRRLHDTNKSGWWQLIDFVPLVGWLVLLLFLTAAPTTGTNRFGSNPHGDPAIIMPQDGGAPYAYVVGRFIECPYCRQRNPHGRTKCQWCHHAYRELESPV